MEMDRFEASDGVGLAYRIDDFTPPWQQADWMVLLHPAMGTSARWFSWMPRLCSRYRVARLDLRGHGQSDVPGEEEPLTLARLVEDVSEFLDHIDAERAHFVGNSAGGYLSQRMAIEQPERVRSIALYGSTPGLRNSGARAWLPQIAQKGLRGFFAETIDDRMPRHLCDAELVEWYLDVISQNDPGYIGRFVTLMSDHEWSDELHLIRCPTLVVIPGGGRISPLDAYAAMGERIPDVDVRIYDDAPHTICDVMPERCIDDLLDFLDRVSARHTAAG
jgi:pimeloyl-ACP methyl ester carboxylesterase